MATALSPVGTKIPAVAMDARRIAGHLAVDLMLDCLYARALDWNEAKVKRGQPENKGEFASKGEPGVTEPEADPRAEKKKATYAANLKKWGGEGPRKLPRYKTGITLKPAKQRVFQGEPVELKTPWIHEKRAKLITDRIGEAAVVQYLQDHEFKDARPAPIELDTKRNNLPLDLIQDHEGIEVKSGLVSNSDTAQHWRQTIGGTSKKYKEWRDRIDELEQNGDITHEEASAVVSDYNEQKSREIMQRKNDLCKALTKRLGKQVKARTVTCIVNPDTKSVDIFSFPGFHDRIPWTLKKGVNPAINKAYLGTYTYK